MSTLLAEEVCLANVAVHLPTSYETTSSALSTAAKSVYFTSQYTRKPASERVSTRQKTSLGEKNVL